MLKWPLHTATPNSAQVCKNYQWFVKCCTLGLCHAVTGAHLVTTFSVTPLGDTRPLTRTCGVGSLVSRGNANTVPWDAELKYNLPEDQSQSSPWMSSTSVTYTSIRAPRSQHFSPSPHTERVKQQGYVYVYIIYMQSLHIGASYTNLLLCYCVIVLSYRHGTSSQSCPNLVFANTIRSA